MLAPRIYTVYFQKAYGKRLFKTDTDVRGSIQQRVCAANTLVKNVQGCTFFTVPPLYFCSRLVSGITIFKRLTEGVYRKCGCWKSSTYQNGQGCPWFHAAASLVIRLNSEPKNVQDVHSWACLRLICARASYLHRLFQKAYGRGLQEMPQLK